MQRGARFARQCSLAVLLMAALACGEGPAQATPDPAAQSGRPAGTTKAPLDPSLEGVCAPAASSCGEWCDEHGVPEAECVPCRENAAHKRP